MKQDPTTGAFHFKGSESDVASRWLWTVLLDTSFLGRLELTWRIWFKKPPKWVKYKKVNYYQEKSFQALNRLAGKKE